MPSRNRDNILQRTHLDWFVLVVGVTEADLTFFVVAGSPNLAVDQEKGVVFAAGDHLNILVS